MAAERSVTPSREMKISPWHLLAVWFFVLFLPLGSSLIALDYFLRQYQLFSEPVQMEIARQQIEECRHLLVPENYLEARIPLLENIDIPAGSATIDALQLHIDRIIGGRGMQYVFFDQKSAKLLTRSSRPADLKRQLPPVALFRKLISCLQAENYQSSTAADNTDSGEKLRNSLQVQQMYRTLTAVNIRPGKVAKNLSVAFGGELYFTYFEFKKPQADQLGCLAIIRGKELSWSTIFEQIRLKHQGFRIRFHQTSALKTAENPGKLFNSVSRHNNDIIITVSADQRFIRSWLHNFGLQLNQKKPELQIPYIEFHLPEKALQHDFHSLRKNFRSISGIIILLSLVQLLYMSLFGIGLNTSFKNRILVSLILVSTIPFAFLAAGFHLHQQFDEFLAHQNLILHIETRLTQINNELKQYMENLESKLIFYGKKIDRVLFDDLPATEKFFRNLGRIVPVSALAMHRLRDSQTIEFPDRVSQGNQNNSINMIERFMPRQVLQLMNEPEPIIDRRRQDIMIVAGNLIKNAAIEEGLRTNGQFYYVDHNDSVIWYSMYKLYDKELPNQPFIGILGGKFEPGPILASFTSQLELAANDFNESFGDFQIRFAFFPTARTGALKTWSGSGHVTDPVLRKARRVEASQNLAEIDENGRQNYLVSRYNHRIPHILAAHAMRSRDSANSSGMAILALAALILYLCIVFFMVSRLLEHFFVSPVRNLAAGAERIARGGDAWNLALMTGDEFEDLNRSFSELVVGLKQRNMLSDYVSEDAISEIEQSSNRNMAPGGEYIEATIIFAAIRDYSRITADYSPDETVELLNRFITIGDQLVKKHGGTIDKIIDYTLMLVFRENELRSDSHALRASRTALELAEAMRSQNLDIYAGIASGTVISGRIGSYSGKLDFTVIGDQVNLAARLKAEAINSTTGLIISGSTMRLLKGKGRVNFLRRCSLKGKAREYNIYELYDLRNL